MSEQFYKTETNAVLRFYEEAGKNNFLSEKEGRPIYDSVLMCEVITPGQTASTLAVEIERTLNEAAGLDESGNRKVKRSGHYAKYQKQVEAYKGATGEYLEDGTPIEQWAQVDRGQAQTLRQNGIRTIEALASVPDSALDRLGLGGRMLRDKAKSYLTSRMFGAPDAQNTAALIQAQSRIGELEAEVAELKSALANTRKRSTETETPQAHLTVPEPEPAVV